MSTPQLTEATIRSLASTQSYSRGEEYFESGAVTNLVKRGNTLSAQVEGSSYEPYRVTIELDAAGVADATCTCPYDYEGLCKHIVAVLIAYVRQPDRFAEGRPVNELLADLSRDELQELLAALIADQPHLADWIEVQLAARITKIKDSPVKAAKESAQRHTPIDPKTFRRRAQDIMGSLSHLRLSEAYWFTSGMVDELRKLVDQTRPFLEAGDGRNALVILEAVTEVYLDRWIEFDDSDGDLGGFFADLGALFAEAMLSADFSQKERQAWVKKLTGWQKEVEDYGIDEGLPVAIAAAKEGWEDSSLQRAMQGQIPQRRADEEERSWYADELAAIRLKILERQGKTNEYLNLAKAEGHIALYTTMLVKLERSQEAIGFGLEHLERADDALALAQCLREHGQPFDALQVAEHGLTLQTEAPALARWLRDAATGLGRSELALTAARAAFARSFSMQDYQAAQAVAGANWPVVKAELLKLLGSADYAFERIEIYLHEGMVDEAIKAVDARDAYVDYEVLGRVCDAAWQSDPDWVIRQCQRQAEKIMDGGQSQYYHHAVNWLKRARKAYFGSGKASAWGKYLEGLIQKHTRKYSLRPQLEALRKE